MKGIPNEHSLRARMAPFTSGVFSFVEPFQAVTARLLDGYTSATIVGDVDNFMLCGLIFCSGSLFCTDDLVGVQKTLNIFMRHMVCIITLLHQNMIITLPLVSHLTVI